MKKNEYVSPEVIEIGNAETVILGHKDSVGLDSTGEPPFDRQYVEG